MNKNKENERDPRAGAGRLESAELGAEVRPPPRSSRHSCPVTSPATEKKEYETMQKADKKESVRFVGL